jgi:proline dehydrogenase
MYEKNIPLNHPNVFFSQLYGMGDNITFNLAKIGCNACKYLPYGPVKDVIPYLIRRAEENTSFQGSMGRELRLITTELDRRSNN